MVFICLFIFGYAGSLLLHGLSSGCSEWVSLLRYLRLLQSVDSRAHGLHSVATAPGPWRAGSVVVALRLTRSAARGIFPTQGSRDWETVSPALAGGPVPTEPPGKPPTVFSAFTLSAEYRALWVGSRRCQGENSSKPSAEPPKPARCAPVSGFQAQWLQLGTQGERHAGGEVGFLAQGRGPLAEPLGTEAGSSENTALGPPACHVHAPGLSS